MALESSSASPISTWSASANGLSEKGAEEFFPVLKPEWILLVTRRLHCVYVTQIYVTRVPHTPKTPRTKKTRVPLAESRCLRWAKKGVRTDGHRPVQENRFPVPARAKGCPECSQTLFHPKCNVNIELFPGESFSTVRVLLFLVVQQHDVGRKFGFGGELCGAKGVDFSCECVWSMSVGWRWGKSWWKN